MNTNLFHDALAHLNQKIGEDKRILSGAFWGELRIFLAVAKHQSFNGAAKALGMSQPTVSRQVKWLQDRLGAQLLVHSKRGVRLTQRGTVLANILNLLDIQLHELSHELKLERSDAEGLIRISVTEALAGLFVVPQMQALKNANPKLTLHIANPTNMNSLTENHTDILVNFSPETSATVHSLRVGTAHLIPVVTKQYIAAHGMPTRTNLDQHHFVQSSYYMGDAPIWAPWKDTVERSRHIDYCDNSFAYGLMVKSSLGIGLLGTYALADMDAIALDIGIHIKLPVFLHVLPSRLEAKPARIVYEWLCGIFSDRHPWFADELDRASLPVDLLAPVVAKLISRS